MKSTSGSSGNRPPPAARSWNSVVTTWSGVIRKMSVAMLPGTRSRRRRAAPAAPPLGRVDGELRRQPAPAASRRRRARDRGRGGPGRRGSGRRGRPWPRPRAGRRSPRSPDDRAPPPRSGGEQPEEDATRRRRRPRGGRAAADLAAALDVDRAAASSSRPLAPSGSAWPCRSPASVSPSASGSRTCVSGSLTWPFGVPVRCASRPFAHVRALCERFPLMRWRDRRPRPDPAGTPVRRVGRRVGRVVPAGDDARVTVLPTSLVGSYPAARLAHRPRGAGLARSRARARARAVARRRAPAARGAGRRHAARDPRPGARGPRHRHRRRGPARELLQPLRHRAARHRPRAPGHDAQPQRQPDPGAARHRAPAPRRAADASTTCASCGPTRTAS